MKQKSSYQKFKAYINLLIVAVVLLGAISVFAQRRSALPGANTRGGQQSEKLFNLGDYVELQDSIKGEMYGQINFPNAELQDIVNAISTLAQKNFLLDDNLKNKRVTILSPQQVTKEEAYNAFLSALYMKGLTIVSSGKFLKIVETKDSARVNTRVFYGDYVPNSAEVVTLVLPLENLDAEEIPRYLQDMMPRTGRVLTVPKTNSIIVSDTGYNLRRLISVIKSIDIPGLQPQLEAIPIQYASAKQIAEMIDEILEAQQGGNTRSSRRSSRNQTAKKIQGGGIITKIVPDDRTNSLVVLANGRGVEELKKIIRRLDNPGAANKGNIHIYYCQNAIAEELAQTLNGLVQGQQPQDPNVPGGSRDDNNNGNPRTGDRNNRNNNDRRTTVAQGGGGITLDGEVKITADKATNSLVVKASASDYASLKEILEKLDIPRRQVYVEATIMEIQVDDDRNLSVGVNLAADNTPTAGGFIPTTFSDFASSLSSPAGINGLLAGIASGAASFTPPGADDPITIPSVAAFLKAITTNNLGHILHQPNILTSDNQEASIKVTEKVTVPGESAQIGTGDNLQVTRSFDSEEVVIELKLTPQIGENSDLVKLTVEQNVDDFSESTLGQGQVDVTQRVAKTSVVVKDNHTIAIGGLQKEDIKETRSRVPLLGDIPVIGALFRGSSTKKIRSNLILFLTPKIINSDDDLTMVSLDMLESRKKLGDSAKDPKDRHAVEVRKMLKRVKGRHHRWGFRPEGSQSVKSAGPDNSFEENILPENDESDEFFNEFEEDMSLPPPPPSEFQSKTLPDLKKAPKLNKELAPSASLAPNILSDQELEAEFGDEGLSESAFEGEGDSFEDLPDLEDLAG